MGKVIFIFLFFLIEFCAFSQGTVNVWNKSFGGSSGSNENIYDIITTCDGGFLMVGNTNSAVANDISQLSLGSYDYWVLKTDSLGDKLWDARFGGNMPDYAYEVIQTIDKEFLVCGISSSGISGNKTVPNWDMTLSSSDIWVVKIDSLGNYMWDNRYGGTLYEGFQSIVATNDGGFILVGVSNSDISGDKSEPNFDDSLYYYDGWVFKIDSLGQIVWDRTLGGSNHETLVGITPAVNGGFIITGESKSNAEGTKSEDNRDTTLMTADFWIVKISDNGTVSWDKRFGGESDDYATSCVQFSNGYLVSGRSYSTVFGDKTVMNHDDLSNTNYYSDFWVVKIDLFGNKIWDKVYGSDRHENGICQIEYGTNGNYIITGNSDAMLPSGDKSEANIGNEQTWVICIDVNGNKIWDNTMQLNGTENHARPEAGTVVTADGKFVTASWTTAGVGGDKDQASYGGYDFFMLKYEDPNDISGATYDPCKVVPVTVSIDDDKYQKNFNFYPNPNMGSFIIERTFSTDETIKIFDILGNQIYRTEVDTNSSELLLNLDLTQGIYIIEISDEWKTFSRESMVVIK